MTVYGTSINANDTFSIIYNIFFELFNEGYEVDVISEKLINDNKANLEIIDIANVFWFALALSQWECNSLSNQVFLKVKYIIESEADIEVWRNNDALEKDIAKRKRVLIKFLAKLQEENKKPKNRKPNVFPEFLYKKGDCLSFKLDNGNYGGLLVLDLANNDGSDCYLLALTRLNESQKPEKESFQDSEILITNFEPGRAHTIIRWYEPKNDKKILKKIEVCGNIELQSSYELEYWQPICTNLKDTFLDKANEQFKSEETIARMKLRLYVKDVSGTVPLDLDKWSYNL